MVRCRNKKCLETGPKRCCSGWNSTSQVSTVRNYWRKNEGQNVQWNKEAVQCWVTLHHRQSTWKWKGSRRLWRIERYEQQTTNRRWQTWMMWWGQLCENAQTTSYNMQNLSVSTVRERISVVVNCGQGYVRDSIAVRIRIRISVGFVVFTASFALSHV